MEKINALRGSATWLCRKRLKPLGGDQAGRSAPCQPKAAASHSSCVSARVERATPLANDVTCHASDPCCDGDALRMQTLQRCSTWAHLNAAHAHAHAHAHCHAHACGLHAHMHMHMHRPLECASCSSLRSHPSRSF